MLDPVRARVARWIARGAAGLLGLALLAGGIALAWAGPRHVARFAKVWSRVQRGTSRDLAMDLRWLAANGKGMDLVRQALEARLDDPNERVRQVALQALVRHYPASDYARAVKEYQEITGETYWNGWAKVLDDLRDVGAREDLPVEDAVRRLATLVRMTDDRFPGRDDAGLRLGRCQERAGDARAACLTLIAALDWGDRDARGPIRDRLANVIDAQLSLEDTLDLARTPPRADVQATLLYAAAVKLARRHRFEEAEKTLTRAIETARFGGTDPVIRDAYRIVGPAKHQRALYRRLAKLADVAAGELLLREPHAFANIVLHDGVVTDRNGRPPESLADGCDLGPRDEDFVAYCEARNHLTHAATFFERARPATPEARRRALLGAAAARLGILGSWGTRPGHAVAQPTAARLELAAHACALALASGADLEAAIRGSGILGRNGDPGVARTQVTLASLNGRRSIDIVSVLRRRTLALMKPQPQEIARGR